MDADDIARASRCQKQIDIFDSKDISIVSGIVEEFSIGINTIEARRIVPKTNREIINNSKTRNPFNHPYVMFKKNDIEEVGDYQDFFLPKDYYLLMGKKATTYKNHYYG